MCGPSSYAPAVFPSVSSILKSFIGNRSSGLIFQTSSRKSVTQTNLLRRELHPLLVTRGIPLCGFHAFRRFRNTFLRQSHCPDGILKFWLGHAAKDMSDHYDLSGQDMQYRRDVTRAMGTGFDVPDPHPESLQSERENVRNGPYRTLCRNGRNGGTPLLTTINIGGKLVGAVGIEPIRSTRTIELTGLMCC